MSDGYRVPNFTEGVGNGEDGTTTRGWLVKMVMYLMYNSTEGLVGWLVGCIGPTIMWHKKKLFEIGIL